MLYFTDTLYLAPAFVGVLFFVARIWDAINDPMMGMIVDNTHTRFGKFRIWLVIGTLVNSVVFVLLFHSFHLSGTALYVYFIRNDLYHYGCSILVMASKLDQ